MERIELIFGKYPLKFRDGVFPLTSDSVFLAWFASEARGKGIDLGCGAGTLGILMAARGAQAPDGVEVSPEAASLAAENYSACGLKGSIRCADMRCPPPEMRSAYSYCVFNPPYFEGKTGKLGAARGNTCGGADAFFEGCSDFLAPGGCIYFCIRPEGTKAALESLNKKGYHARERRYVRHSPSHNPFLELILAAEGDGEEVRGEDISIFDENGEYTPLWHEIYRR